MASHIFEGILRVPFTTLIRNVIPLIRVGKHGPMAFISLPKLGKSRPELGKCRELLELPLVKEDVTIITSSDIGAKHLIPKYTILLKTGSWLWNNLVIAKKHSVASRVPIVNKEIKGGITYIGSYYSRISEPTHWYTHREYTC